ncbi:cytochrome oxidase subunit III [Alphaproteobacteria bacterium]|nr:cytochrome oxidase subunit III [Alphaproteobacteria bacterium]
MSKIDFNLIGWGTFVISALGFIISSIGNFWAMFGSVFFLLGCIVFLIPYFLKKDKGEIL